VARHVPALSPPHPSHRYGTITSGASGVAFLQYLVVGALCCFELARYLVSLPLGGVALGHDLIPLPLYRPELGRDSIASGVRLLTLVRYPTQPAAHLV
jgi:hypothetical protein